jgi:hypothetical protein
MKNKLKDTHLPPEQLIQRQLDCYNAKDIEGLLAAYAADVEHYDLRGNLLENLPRIDGQLSIV